MVLFDLVGAVMGLAIAALVVVGIMVTIHYIITEYRKYLGKK